MPIQRLCKNCQRSFAQYNTTQNLCGKCAYNKYSKPQQHITRLGKKASAWIERRHNWIQWHPAVDGYWECYLRISPRCLPSIDIDQLTIDHVVPRSSSLAEATDDDSNLMPACVFCNGMKGSRHLENIPEFTNWEVLSKRGTQ